MGEYKVSTRTCIWAIFIIGGITLVSAAPSAIISWQPDKDDPDRCHPTIIAHRGASGYVPEHTLGSYALAVIMGADYVEPDLVMTKDGHLVARHDNELGLTTNVADHPEFADRHRNQTVDGNQISGWFTEDFTLAEIKTLRAIERIPNIRPGNARMNDVFKIPTFQEIIDLVKSLQISQKRTIGLYPEIKHSSHFKKLGLPMEQRLVDTFHSNGYRGLKAPVYIQSFEVENLKQLKEITGLRLLQLYESDKSLQPADQVILGTNLTYGDMATPEGLQEVAKYAYAVGPDKSFIIPRKEDNTLGEPTSFVNDAHAAGLKVHPYTFRAENTFLPKEFQSDDPELSARGDLVGELRAYIAAGIDGLFSDQPDIPVSIRENC
ncbi:glycerophosphodiester phosphodiesterase GDPD6-like [Colias croceus]|uniref:glycerophosphodiester phosphodiesterase GDPD6-like n=1 Tax=Colias crocea TaxID=72248 RepID=UPI001E27B8A3|nr:glycerophosphodiester phosphodiesterase GDPD6-like [Colias croceus]